MKKNNLKNFIQKAKSVHGDKYDYSKSVYLTSETKLCIICPEHGEFWQSPYVHNNLKCGCPKCGHIKTNKSKSLTTKEFIKQAREIHGDKYDYSKVEYVNNHTKVCIICPEHGEFWQRPDVHIRGNGCHKCSIDKKRKLFSNTKQIFVEQAREIHGDKYDYSKVNYVNSRTKVCIICPEHGEFWQEPSLHISSKYGCPKCGRKGASISETLSNCEFIEKAKKIHGDKYDYSKTDYKNSKSLVGIICRKHGFFLQTPDAHLHGAGCPRCSQTKSKGEEEIFQLIKKSYSGVIETRNRTEIPPYELDIYIPNENIAIEYNGLRWHSEQFNKDKNYHLRKLEKCNEKNIKLISIFEDEWLLKKDVVTNKILHLLKLNTNKNKIYARNCKTIPIDKNTANCFLEKYHIQGKSNSTLNYGCFYEDVLIGVMSFKILNKKNEWELTRFATNYDYICCGVGGKLFKTFITDKNPSFIKSFADRRWTLTENDNLYTKIGFKLYDTLKPDYKYIVDNKRIHKFNFRKKNICRKYNFPVNMTEKEITTKMGIDRIWDCGLFKYIWTN